MIYGREVFDFAYLSKTIMEKRMEPVLKEFHLKKTDIYLLCILHFYPTIKTAKQICDIGDLKRGNVSFIVEDLTNRGLITQETVENDRRAKYLSLTDAALPVIEAVNTITVEHNRTAIEGIPEEDLKVCQKVLGQMMVNLKKYNEKKEKRGSEKD